MTDLGALAVVFASRNSHMFVYGLPVEVDMDHQAITASQRSNVSPRVLRWALEFQKYWVKIIYVKGAKNRVADALSIPISESKMKEPTPNETIVARTSGEPDWTTERRAHPV